MNGGIEGIDKEVVLLYTEVVCLKLLRNTMGNLNDKSHMPQYYRRNQAHYVVCTRHTCNICDTAK
jgi:hypothetical protein